MQALYTFEQLYAAALTPGGRLTTIRHCKDGRFPKPLEIPGSRLKPWPADVIVEHWVPRGLSRERVEAALEQAARAHVEAYAKAKAERSDKASKKRIEAAAKAGLVPANA